MNDTSPNSESLSLAEEVSSAFAGVTLGSGLSLDQAEALDDWQGLPSRPPRRGALDWSKIPHRRLRRFQEFSVLDAEGMRYYLPAFMVWILTSPDDQDSDADQYLVWTLQTDPESGAFERLDESQRRVTAKFLEFRSRFASDRFDRSDELEALKTWKAFL
ncbi:MAG: DUF6714 family protein [Planctomycetota bacterium]